MVEDKDKHPRTMAATLRFLQYHNLSGKQHVVPKETKQPSGGKPELTFTTANGDDDVRDGPEDEDTEVEPNKESKLCGQFRDGTCLYKKQHT